MVELIEFPDRRELAYVRVLLRERRHQLQRLESGHRRMSTVTGDYASCRRSLLQAIQELKSILRTSAAIEKE